MSERSNGYSKERRADPKVREKLRLSLRLLIWMKYDRIDLLLLDVCKLPHLPLNTHAFEPNSKLARRTRIWV